MFSDIAGDVIVAQFSGDMGERMKDVYGKFCSRHKEGIDYYKALYKTERKFQAFIKVRGQLPNCIHYPSIASAVKRMRVNCLSCL